MFRRSVCPAIQFGIVRFILFKDVVNGQAVLCAVLFSDIEVGELPTVTNQVPKLSNVRRRDKTAGNKVVLKNVGNPFCILLVGFLAFDCFHIFRVGENNIAGRLQNVVDRNPIFTR